MESNYLLVVLATMLRCACKAVYQLNRELLLLVFPPPLQTTPFKKSVMRQKEVRATRHLRKR